jgi:hypothetical protein
MKSKEKGDLVVAKGISYYVENGYEVLLPIGDKRPYDFVIEKDGNLSKIQCKYAGQKSPYGVYVASLRVMGGNQSYHTAKSYKKGDFDKLFVLTGERIMYEIPCSVTNKLKNSINLGKSYNKYKVT